MSRYGVHQLLWIVAVKKNGRIAVGRAKLDEREVPRPLWARTPGAQIPCRTSSATYKRLCVGITQTVRPNLCRCEVDRSLPIRSAHRCQPGHSRCPKFGAPWIRVSSAYARRASALTSRRAAPALDAASGRTRPIAVHDITLASRRAAFVGVVLSSRELLACSRRALADQSSVRAGIRQTAQACKVGYGTEPSWLLLGATARVDRRLASPVLHWRVKPSEEA